jgi:hypothetical protein
MKCHQKVLDILAEAEKWRKRKYITPRYENSGIEKVLVTTHQYLDLPRKESSENEKMSH